MSERRSAVCSGNIDRHSKAPRGADDPETALTEDIIALAAIWPLWLSPGDPALLRDAGWHVNRKRVERISLARGLKVPQATEARAVMAQRRIVHRRPKYPGHVWSYDFVEGRTTMAANAIYLSIIDEASRECTTPRWRTSSGDDVLAALAELFVTRGPPAHIRSDNGRSLSRRRCSDGSTQIGVKTLYITPGSPWENSCAKLQRIASR